MENRVLDQLAAAPLGAWRFDGFLGERVDRAGLSSKSALIFR